MSADDDILDHQEEKPATFGFEFELHTSDDGHTITLLCYADKELTPEEYSMALKEFAGQIEVIVNMTDVQSGPLN